MRFAALLALAIVLTPLQCFAEQEVLWDFRNGQVPGDWNGSGIQPPQATVDGLLIQSATAGQLIRPPDAGRIDTVYITLRAIQPGMMRFLWNLEGTKELVGFPIELQPSASSVTVSLNMALYARQWDATPDVVGFGFDENTAVLIESIRFVGFSRLERLWNIALSFFTFDGFTGYSVNFLWGPMLTDTPLGRQELFSRPLPAAVSANWIFFFVFAVGASVLLLCHRLGRCTKRHVAIGITLLCSLLWIAYDLRMGTEFMNYLRRDYLMYWSQPVGERQYRLRGDFYDFATQVTPMLQKRDYVVVPAMIYPFVPILRYYTYPDLPVKPEATTAEQTQWVVYDRPDVTVGADARLYIGTGAVTAPGRIEWQYSDDSFLFTTQP